MRSEIWDFCQSAPSGELLLSSVKFSVPVRVDFGETVKVVGNHPALGSWDTGNGVELEWNDGHVWEKQVHITPGEYEFKVFSLCTSFSEITASSVSSSARKVFRNGNRVRIVYSK